jgi:hypothetical protein
MMQLVKPVIEARPPLRLAANAVFHPLIDARDKALVFVAVRACAQGRGNAAQHRSLLAERAGLIPTFYVFRALVLEDLRDAYCEDRENKTRTARLRRLSWLTLFKSFARLHRIDQVLKISALDHSGNYACELVDKEAPDLWDRWIALGCRLGVPHAQMMQQWRDAKGAAARRDERKASGLFAAGH